MELRETPDGHGEQSTVGSRGKANGPGGFDRRQLRDLRACYSGCMLGISLTATVFRRYAREYGVHRQRMVDCLREFGVNVALPLRHKDFVAQHSAILETVQTEIARMSPPCHGWMLFGCTLIEFAVKRAFRRPEAAAMRRALTLFLDKVQMSRALLTQLGRKCRTKDGSLSLNRLHSAALAMLNGILGCMRGETGTAFVAMPFSVPHMLEHYANLYVPLLRSLQLKPLRAWGGFGTEDYQDLLYTLIDRCGALLADITTLNPNVMHEVGYALGKGKKFIILIAEKGQAVPANLGDLTVLTYRAKGRDWQSRAAAEIAATVALYQYAATLEAPGGGSRRIVGPMKVTE
jgi:hypothetical protein